MGVTSGGQCCDTLTRTAPQGGRDPGTRGNPPERSSTMCLSDLPGNLASRIPPLRRALVGLAILACGCGDQPRSADAPATRDSAGIRIVENAGPTAATWSATEVVRVGDIDGPESTTFHRIADLEVIADRVYVLDAGDAVVKVYDRAGAYLASFGGPGQGPAEFEGAEQLIRRGDTLSVYDYRLVKFAHFETAGTLLGTERARFSEDAPFLGAGMEAVSGGLVAWTASGSCRLPPPEDRRVLWTLLATESNGLVLDTLAVRPGRSGISLYLPDDAGCTVVSRLAGRVPHIAVSADGRIAFGEGDGYRIELIRMPGGRLEAIFGRRLDPLPVTDEERSTHRRDVLNPDRPYPLDARFRRVLEAAWDTTPAFETWPHYSALRFDAQGRLWVRRTYRTGAEVAKWDIFEETGGLFASAELPARLEVRLIESDTIWGVERVEFGVEQLVGYALERGGG